MNKGMLAVFMMAVMAMPVMAGSIGNANYFDQYNILGWGVWQTLNDNTVNIDADRLQGYVPQTFFDYSDDGDAYTLINANAYSDLGDANTLASANSYTSALRTNLLNGNIIVAHSNYANHAGNADTLDGWDASDLNRYTRQRVRTERNRAIGVETDLQNQIDMLDFENTDAHNDLGSSIDNAFWQIAELRKDVTELQGVTFEYETDKNFNDFSTKCGVFSKMRMGNEADKLNYDAAFKTTANTRTRNALENAVGMINGKDENTGLTKEICYNQIPSAYSGYDYNQDGNIDSRENLEWCVVYPAFQSEREKYPCEIEQVFNSAFIKNEQYVIYKDVMGEPVLLHISPEDYNNAAIKAEMNKSSATPTPLTKEQLKCLATKAKINC